MSSAANVTSGLLHDVAGRIAADLGMAADPRETVGVERAGQVLVLKGPAWTAWIMAVFPTDTDPVLVAAARIRADGALPQRADESDDGGADPLDECSKPGPEIDVRTILPNWDQDERALGWATTSSMDSRELAAMTSRAVSAAHLLRESLVGSVSPHLASLGSETRALIEQAARIAQRTAAPTTGLGHLAAVLLTEPELEPETTTAGSTPDPDLDLVTLLSDLDGEPAITSRLRVRVAEQLAARQARTDLALGRDQTGQATPDDEPLGTDLLGHIAGDLLPGVRLLAPSADASTRDTHDGGSSGPDARAAAEVTTHLSRRDADGVALSGPPEALRRVLTLFASRAASSRAPRLARRRLLQVDSTRLPSTREAQLRQLISESADSIILALTHPSSRVALSLITASRAERIPLILLTPRAHFLTLYSDLEMPVVRLPDEQSPAGPHLTRALTPVAEELATYHGVSLDPRVVEAAAAAAPGSRPDSGDPEDDPADDDETLVPDTDVRRLDPVALGRARLDYACARAAMRADHHVVPDDVPIDPRKGTTDPSDAQMPEQPSAAQITSVLQEGIVDQPDVVAELIEWCRRAVRGPRRTGPTMTLLLAGLPGTGKTHTSSVVAKACFDDPGAVIRIDCGSLYDQHTIATLLGAPPAYVGYTDTARLLTTQINARRGNAVVLFDEIEKAHPRILDMLLGVLDTGRLVDLRGRTADASNSIFLLTSNLGSEGFARQATGFGEAGLEQRVAAVHAEVRSHLRPELFDRLDDVLVYRPLTRSGMVELTQRHLSTITDNLAQAGYRIQLDTDTRHWLSTRAEAQGSRALRRYLEATLLRGLLMLPQGMYSARVVAGEVIWEGVDPKDRTQDLP